VLESAEIAAIVPVSEIDRAVEFYGNILGLCKDPDGNIIAFEERTGAG
jgi:extradiol dioxygenase family protein